MKKRVDKKLLLKQQTLKKIDRFLTNLKLHSLEDNSIQLFHMIKTFFALFFKIKYSFTYEELLDELEKKKIKDTVRNRIMKLVNETENYEYKRITNKKTAYKKIRELAKEFKSIVEELVTDKETTKEKKVLIPTIKIKLFSMRRKKRRFIKRKIRPHHVENVEKIYNLLLLGNESLTKNLERAKTTYNKIKKLYEHLPETEKKEVYKDILLFYKRLLKESKQIKSS